MKPPDEGTCIDDAPFTFCHFLVHSQSAWKGVVQESCDHFGRSSNEEYNTVVCFDTVMSSVVSLSADMANWQQETE